MKKVFKRFFMVLCVLSMVLSLSACGREKELVEYDQQTVESNVNSIIQTISQITPEQLEQYDLMATTESDQQMIAVFKEGQQSFADAKEELGDIIGVSSVDVTADEENVTAIAHVAGTLKTAQIEIIFDKRQTPTSITTNVDRTVGENMTNAALNTLLGMGTVFVVLIFICFIISLFKYVNAFEKKMKQKNAPENSKAAVAADKAVAQIVSAEEAADDTELVAVIAAAIAAYEEQRGGSSEGYQVRSIKRRA